jgi:hypothetical protein
MSQLSSEVVTVLSGLSSALSHILFPPLHVSRTAKRARLVVLASHAKLDEPRLGGLVWRRHSHRTINHGELENESEQRP